MIKERKKSAGQIEQIVDKTYLLIGNSCVRMEG